MNPALIARLATALAGFFNNGTAQIRNAANQSLVSIGLASNAMQGGSWINSRTGAVGTAGNGDQAPHHLLLRDDGDSGELTVPIGQETTLWAAGQTVTDGDVRTHNGANFQATIAHTTGATDEPGVGANWRDRWRVVAGLLGPATLDPGDTFTIGSFNIRPYSY